MNPQQIARTTGVLFLITFVTSILALILYQPVLDDPVGYVAGAGSDNRIFWATLLELLLIIANLGTAVVPYPVLRRQNGLYLTFKGFRPSPVLANWPDERVSMREAGQPARGVAWARLARDAATLDGRRAASSPRLGVRAARGSRKRWI